MNRWSIEYGPEHYNVHIERVPFWRVVASETWEGILAALGHPCCATLKWIPTEWLTDRVSVLQFRLLNNRLALAAYGKHSVTVEKFPITEHHASLISPEFVADMRETFSEDEETA